MINKQALSRRLRATLAAALGLGLMAAQGIEAASASTLEDVRGRDKLICGISEGLAGFSDKDEAGNWYGFDVDFCRAVAAAVLGDPQKVDYVQLSANDRFKALTDGKIDLLSRNSTWTMSRDLDLDLRRFPRDRGNHLLRIGAEQRADGNGDRLGIQRHEQSVRRYLGGRHHHGAKAAFGQAHIRHAAYLDVAQLNFDGRVERLFEIAGNVGHAPRRAGTCSVEHMVRIAGFAGQAFDDQVAHLRRRRLTCHQERTLFTGPITLPWRLHRRH